jgi:hypothetical protein
MLGDVSDKDYAKENKIPFADCNNATNKTSVIYMNLSDSPFITKIEKNTNCYYIGVGRCENVAAVEKIIVGILAQINNASIA